MVNGEEPPSARCIHQLLYTQITEARIAQYFYKLLQELKIYFSTDTNCLEIYGTSGVMRIAHRQHYLSRLMLQEVEYIRDII